MSADRPEGMTCSYEELRRVPDALGEVEDALFAEQGGLCAYTGHRIGLTRAKPDAGTQRAVEFHIEHLTPQAHCSYGQDAEYGNMVACWPPPNCGFEPAYGARKKGNWPRPGEETQFVSPLRDDCSDRFSFSHRGEIGVAQPGDQAAAETIKRLALDDRTLTALRKGAIRGALNPGSRPIRLTEARRLLAQMDRDSAQVDQGRDLQLAPFSFAIRPALEREVRKLKAIIGHA